MIHAPKTFATLGFALSLASGGPATNAHAATAPDQALVSRGAYLAKRAIASPATQHRAANRSPAACL